jgi:DNA-binding ferritin-like protein (Dps family)
MAGSKIIFRLILDSFLGLFEMAVLLDSPIEGLKGEDVGDPYCPMVV